MDSGLPQGEYLDEEALEDAPDAERLRQEEELVERLTAAETRDELEEEINTLQKLIDLAREAERNENRNQAQRASQGNGT